MTVVYKIRSAGGSFSNGIITPSYSNGVTTYYVKWSKKGKEWTTEKAVKAHLEKAVSNNISITGWEVIQVVYSPTKPLDEWIDPKMLMSILKK